MLCICKVSAQPCIPRSISEWTVSSRKIITFFPRVNGDCDLHCITLVEKSAPVLKIEQTMGSGKMDSAMENTRKKAKDCVLVWNWIQSEFVTVPSILFRKFYGEEVTEKCFVVG